MTTTTETVKPLPTTVYPADDESLPAYLGRLIRANGDTRRVLAHVDLRGPRELDAWHDVYATPNALEVTSALAGISVEELLRTLAVRLLREQGGHPRITGRRVPPPLMFVDRLRSCGICTHKVEGVRRQGWSDPSAFACRLHETLLTGDRAPIDDDVLIAQHLLRQMYRHRNRDELRAAVNDAVLITNRWSGPAGALRVAASWTHREASSGVSGRDSQLLRAPEVVGLAFTLLAEPDPRDRHTTLERLAGQSLNARSTQRWLRLVDDSTRWR